MIREPKCPEHEKLEALDGKNNVVGSFLEWLEIQGYGICKANEHGRLVPSHKRPHDWLAKYFEIDRDKLEAEKQALLKYVRAVNAEKEETHARNDA